MLYCDQDETLLIGYCEAVVTPTSLKRDVSGEPFTLSCWKFIHQLFTLQFSD